MPPPPPPSRQQQQQEQQRPSASTTTTASASAANLNAAVAMAGLGQEEREEMFLGQLEKEAKGAGAGTSASNPDAAPNAADDKDAHAADGEVQKQHGPTSSSGAEPSGVGGIDTTPFGADASDASANSYGSYEESSHQQGQETQGEQQQYSQGYGGYGQQQQQQQAGWARQPQQSQEQHWAAWQQQQEQQQKQQNFQGYEGYQHHQQGQPQQDQYYAMQQRQEGAQPPSNAGNDPATSSGRMVPYQPQHAQQQQRWSNGGMRQPPLAMQQRRPPPPGYHTQQQQNRAPTMFNGLLRRLEKGMDAVASLEDVVDKRARALGRTVKYATAGKMTVKEAVAASVAGSRKGLVQIRRAERKARAAPNMFDLFKDDIEAAEAQVEEAEAQAAVEDGHVGGTMATSLLSSGGATADAVPSPFAVESKGPGGAGNVSPEQPSSPIAQLLGQPSAPEPTSVSSSAPDRQNLVPPQPRKAAKDDDDDGDWSVDSSKGGPLSRAFGLLPNPASLFRRRDSLLDLDDWSDEDDNWDTAPAKQTSTPPSSVRQSARQVADSGVPLPVSNLLGRGDSRTGESGFSLLSRQEGYQCHRLGRTRSLFDIAALVFLVVAINELTPFIVAALKDTSTIVFQGRDGVIPIVGDIQGGKKLLSALFTAFSSACKDSWAHLAFASALLSIWSNDVFVRPTVRRTASAVSAHVRDQTSSSQMFLRLVAGLPPRKAMPDVFAQSARRQVWSDVEASRLRSLVGMSTIALIALTVSVAKPIVGAMIGAGADIASLGAWKWPLEWAVLGQGMKSHLGSMALTIGALLGEECTKIVDNPLAVVVQASLFVVLFAISTLPTIVRHIEQKKSASDHLDVDAAVKGLGDDEEECDSERSTAAVLDMGVSSATRLSLLSQPGAVEGVLDRWMLMQPKSSLPRPSAKSRIDSMSQNQGRAGAVFRRVAYEASVLALLCIPVAVYAVIAPSASVDVSERWNTGTRLVSLLLVAYTVSRRVLSSIADEFKLTSSVDSFLRLLSGIVAELAQSNQASQDVLQLAAQTSPDNGITVSDFWAAHAQRRAWACRGAQLSCKNGEVCLVLGDDGSGKSRLLAALGETLVSPPTKSRSTVFVRGRINVGGLDVTRWDKKRLKRNIAIVLNDVRTLSDTAALFSGLTLQEILDPANGSGGGPGSPSHNAMAIAIQVAGLSSLVARLPSKLSTVVTASEDELSPSPTRPSAQILSPSEWNKVLLARSIAQTVLGNDNPMTAPDAVQGSLIGSLLLLDDVTAHANEVEEAVLIKALRATGAATLLTSNHWASGRHANRIVVMKDGAVVESGSHAELMQRGPANSVYALRWKQMTSGV